jgi:hypothetical protein
MSFLDFEEIKRRVSLLSAAQRLGLQMKKNGAQLRGPCTACNQGGDRALVITESKGWYCFAAQKGGDVISLVAHINDCSAKDAAKFLAGHTATTIPSTVPEEAKGGEKNLAPLQYLEPEHEAVVALGFDTEFCKSHGIGWAPKGVARGHVLIPFRDETGRLLGYVGVTDCWLPADFQSNVIPLDKRRA